LKENPSCLPETYFREKGLRVKTAALALVLAGIVILAFS